MPRRLQQEPHVFRRPPDRRTRRYRPVRRGTAPAGPPAVRSAVSWCHSPAGDEGSGCCLGCRRQLAPIGRNRRRGRCARATPARFLLIGPILSCSDTVTVPSCRALNDARSTLIAASVSSRYAVRTRPGLGPLRPFLPPLFPGFPGMRFGFLPTPRRGVSMLMAGSWSGNRNCCSASSAAIGMGMSIALTKGCPRRARPRGPSPAASAPRWG